MTVAGSVQAELAYSYAEVELLHTKLGQKEEHYE